MKYDDPELINELDEELYNKLQEDIELLDMAGNDFDLEKVRQGKLSPVCFGSALTNFGIEPFLKHFLTMTTTPLPRSTGEKIIDPFSEDFSAFVFKIQANMNKAHRDRMAFFRICSGKFTKGMEVYHYQGGRKIKLNQSKQLMADERQEVDEAYAGDIIGFLIQGSFRLEIRLQQVKLNLLLKVFLPLLQNIFH